MSQHYHGDHGYQAGGDIKINTLPEFSSDNPNMVECPQCWLTTGHLSEECRHCGYKVIEHFKKIQQRELSNAALKIGGGLAVLGSIITGISVEFGLPVTYSITGCVFIAFAFIFFIGACNEL